MCKIKNAFHASDHTRYVFDSDNVMVMLWHKNIVGTLKHDHVTYICIVVRDSLFFLFCNYIEINDSYISRLYTM